MGNQAQKLLKKFLILSLMAFTALPVFAVEPITVSLSSNNINLAQTVQVSFTFTQRAISGFHFPRNTSDYDVVASSTSNNIQVVNGKLSQNKTSSFVIKPKHTGMVLIPSLTFQLNGQNYQTEPKQITVTDAPVQASPQAQRASANSARPRVAFQRDLSAKPIVENKISTRTPYVNQQVFIKTKIYHRGNLRGLSLAALQIDHMNIKRLEQTKEYIEKKNGMDYMVYEVEYVAFPLKSGPITIPAYDVKAAVIRERLNGNDRFDPFNFMANIFEEEQITIKAPAISINVKPIPEGAPKAFSGYVGSLAVNHQIDKLEINSGDPVTIKTSVYGNGNPRNLDFNFIDKSKLYSVYKDKDNLNKEINKNLEYFGLNTSSTIIPEKKSGRISIKAKALVNFNPYSGKFESHGAEEFEVFVKASLGKTSNGLVSIPESDDKTKVKNEKFKKELSIFSIAEIERYKTWKDFDSSYLLIILILLNIAYLARYTSRRIKFGDREVKVNYSELTKRIKKAKELEEISSIIKDLEKDVGDNSGIREKFSEFTNETDKYNYGFVKNFDEETLADLKDRAVGLIKELKLNA